MTGSDFSLQCDVGHLEERIGDPEAEDGVRKESGVEEEVGSGTAKAPVDDSPDTSAGKVEAEDGISDDENIGRAEAVVKIFRHFN